MMAAPLHEWRASEPLAGVIVPHLVEGDSRVLQDAFEYVVRSRLDDTYGGFPALGEKVRRVRDRESDYEECWWDETRLSIDAGGVLICDASGERDDITPPVRLGFDDMIELLEECRELNFKDGERRFLSSEK